MCRRRRRLELEFLADDRSTSTFLGGSRLLALTLRCAASLGFRALDIYFKLLGVWNLWILGSGTWARSEVEHRCDEDLVEASRGVVL